MDLTPSGLHEEAEKLNKLPRRRRIVLIVALGIGLLVVFTVGHVIAKAVDVAGDRYREPSGPGAAVAPVSAQTELGSFAPWEIAQLIADHKVHKGYCVVGTTGAAMGMIQNLCVSSQSACILGLNDLSKRYGPRDSACAEVTTAECVTLRAESRLGTGGGEPLPVCFFSHQDCEDARAADLNSDAGLAAPSECHSFTLEP
jgi:hypothetical protein